MPKLLSPKLAYNIVTLSSFSSCLPNMVTDWKHSVENSLLHILSIAQKHFNSQNIVSAEHMAFAVRFKKSVEPS